MLTSMIGIVHSIIYPVYAPYITEYFLNNKKQLEIIIKNTQYISFVPAIIIALIYTIFSHHVLLFFG